jgi:hypothetical protein
MPERRCWLSILVDVLDRFGGSIIAHPSELARDGREVADDWLRCGWPATGTSLVQLERRAAELVELGILVHHTEPGPGQPEWLAVTDLDAPPRVHPRLEVAHPLADKAEAVLRQLVSAGPWTGTVEELRDAGRDVLAALHRRGRTVPGPMWPMHASTLSALLAPLLVELGHRGLVLEVDGAAVAVQLASAEAAA